MKDVASAVAGRQSMASVSPRVAAVESQVAPNRSAYGQLSTVITGIIIVIVAMVAVTIVDSFNNAAGNVQNDTLDGANNNLLDGFANMMDLVGPLLLVLIAAVIIGVVQRFRQQ